MARRGPNRQPTFFWRGALIVLPVIVLAVVGVVSLRQDKVLAQHQATERAQAIADDLAPKIWAALGKGTESDEFGPGAFQVNAAGELVFPPPYSTVPVPRSLDTTELTGEQAGLWSQAREDEEIERNLSSAIDAYCKFLNTNPPEDFRGPARYAAGAILVKQGQPEAAAGYFDALLDEDFNALGESGLPLRPLAELNLQTLAGLGRGKVKHILSIDTLCSNAVYEPTALSPELLRAAAERATAPQARATVRKWRALWDEHQLSRQLFQAARPHIHGHVLDPGRGWPPGPRPTGQPRLFWFTSPVSWKRSITNTTANLTNGAPATYAVEVEGNDWLGIELGASMTNRSFLCLGESEVGARVSALVQATTRVPDYFGVGIELAQRKLTWSVPDLRVWRGVDYFGRRGGGQKKELTDEVASPVLASASQPVGEAGQLKVNVYLTSPNTLFKLQRARTVWVGVLIAAAAFAALAGFSAAYRAFDRQLRLSEMKSNFVSSVSHELRAPIASVRLMAESLERGKVSESWRQQEYFRFIVQECRRLSSLIENVLDFSRIEQGRKEYEFEPTDIMALTQQTVKLMEPCANERQVKLALGVADCRTLTTQYQLSVDGKAIQQALINLIDNAIKHSPKGQTVMVGVGMRSAGGGVQSDSDAERASLAPSSNPYANGHVDLWVEDQGEGIPVADHERIFERFYRRGSELRRETSGVGIGLSIVKHIVEAHGGRVVVRSDVGQGSRFTIELPLGGGDAM